jgi:hypothetical protein
MPTVQNADGGVTITGYTGSQKDVVIPAKISGIAVTDIYGLGWKELTSVVIPNSVTSIGSSAFYGNQLTSVTIGNSVSLIHEGAFYNNKLTSITIGKNVTFGFDVFGEDSAFINYYQSQNKKAGTYIKTGSRGLWSLKQ